MGHNITSLIDTQVSEYVKTTYPLFSEFLKTYFDYANTQNKFNNIIYEYKNLGDVDHTTDELLERIYSTYAEYLPKEIVFDKRNCIKLLNEIYTAKGTEKAVKLLFSLIFGRDINIVYPGQFMLRASDGNWTQERFLVLGTTYGSLDLNLDIGTILRFNEDSNKYIKIIKIEKLIGDTNRLKIFFTTPQIIKFNVGDKLLKLVDGVRIYSGEIKKTLVGVKIDEPGSAWMRGQIFKIHGSVKNTTVKVLNTKDYGKLTSVVITDFGYDHSDNQSITISSYKLKPIGTTYDINRTEKIVGVPLSGYDIVLDIQDFITDFSESVAGYSDGEYDSSNPGYTYASNTENYSNSYPVSETPPYGAIAYVGYPAIADINYAAKVIAYNDYIASTTLENRYTEKVKNIFYMGIKVIDIDIFTTSVVESYSNSNLSIGEWLASRATLSCVFGAEGKTYGYYKDTSGHPSNDIIRLQDNLYYQAFSYLIETDKDISAYKELLHITHPAGTVRFSTLEKEFTNVFGVNSRLDIKYINNDVYIDVVDSDFIEPSDIVRLSILKVCDDDLSMNESIELVLNKLLDDTLTISDSDTVSRVSGSTYIADYFAEAYISPYTQLYIT